MLYNTYFYSLERSFNNVLRRINGIQDDKLKEKAKQLPSLLESAHAASTKEKYQKAWQHWSSWANNFTEIIQCPADPFHISLYFNEIVNQKQSIGFLNAAYCGIRWHHHTSGFHSPTDHPLVKLAFEGAKRTATTYKVLTNKKEPITPDLVKSLVKRYTSSSNLVDMRFIIICLVGFFGFLRISELLEVKIKDIQFSEEGATIFIHKSKTDQMRSGNTIYISEMKSSPYCPIAWLKKYIHATGLNKNPESFLICRLFKTKCGHIADGNQKISYSAARSTFANHISTVTDPSKYSLHSLRSGGASAAANNGVSDRKISKQGRWSSNSSRDGYIKDNDTERFSITKQLGL